MREREGDRAREGEAQHTGGKQGNQGAHGSELASGERRLERRWGLAKWIAGEGKKPKEVALGAGRAPLRACGGMERPDAGRRKGSSGAGARGEGKG